MSADQSGLSSIEEAAMSGDCQSTPTPFDAPPCDCDNPTCWRLHPARRSASVGLCEVTDCGKWVAELTVTWCADHAPGDDSDDKAGPSPQFVALTERGAGALHREEPSVSMAEWRVAVAVVLDDVLPEVARLLREEGNGGAALTWAAGLVESWCGSKPWAHYNGLVEQAARGNVGQVGL